MNTSSINIQSVAFDPNSSFTDLAGSSLDPGPPNYYNALPERSVYPPNDGTGNVGSFISAIGGNSNSSLGIVPESNAGAFAARSDATNSHLPFGSTNVNLFPDRERTDPPSPILNENSLRRAYEAHLNEYNFPGTVGTIRGGSVSTNRDGQENSNVSASIADSTDFDSVSAVNDKGLNTSIRDIQNSIIYGDKKGLNQHNQRFHANVGDPFASRSSFTIKLDKDSKKRIEKANAQYIANGPPILGEVVTLKTFQDWQSDLFDFIERLPDYVPGMLYHKPNMSILSFNEQRDLKSLFTLIHGYLKKAGSKNSKIRVVTSNVRTSPYPDIVEWWSEVNDAFKLTAWEIDDLLEKLNHIKQKNNESCMEYLMRFQEKTNEYINIGNNLSEEEQGRKCLKGLSDKFKSSIFQFMLSKDIPCNIKYFRQLCILADEYGGYSSKPGDEKELEANLVMPSASRTVEFKGNTVLKLLLLPFSNSQTVRYITLATPEFKEALGEMVILQNKKAKINTITNRVIHQTIEVITRGLTRITSTVIKDLIRKGDGTILITVIKVSITLHQTMVYRTSL